MAAKEMFEKLGYKKIEDACTIAYHWGDLQVRFWKNSKHIELFGKSTPDMNIENEEYFESNYTLFIAINKQIEELGWYDGMEI